MLWHCWLVNRKGIQPIKNSQQQSQKVKGQINKNQQQTVKLISQITLKTLITTAPKFFVGFLWQSFVWAKILIDPLPKISQQHSQINPIQCILTSRVVRHTSSAISQCAATVSISNFRIKFIQQFGVGDQLLACLNYSCFEDNSTA